MPQTTAVEPDKILRELHDLWEQLGRDQQTAGGVLRACAMTLMVATDSGAGQADADSVRQTIGVLMHDHPSRATSVACTGSEVISMPSAQIWRWPPNGIQHSANTRALISLPSFGISTMARLG